MSRFACHYVLVDVSSIQAFACSNSAQWCQSCSYVVVLSLSTEVLDGLSGVWTDLKLCSGQCSLLQDLTTVYIFFVLALNVTDVISLCKDIC